MAGADIKLLFGVLGEGSLSGESGQLIQSQLTELMKELNKNPLKVKVGIDTDTGGKKSWSGQLQEKLNQISQSGKFSVQISNLKLSAGAISDFKKQLGAIVNTLGLSTGTEITISSKGIGEIKKDLQDAGAAATDAARKIAEFKVQMEALGGQKNSIKKSIDDLAKTATSDDERARIAEITAQYEQWAVKIEEIRASKSAVTGEYRAQIEAEGAAIRANIESINQERTATEGATRATTEAANARREAGRAAEDAAKQEADAANRAASAAVTQNNLYRQINTTLMQVRDAQKNWTAAENGKTRADYAALDDYVRRLKELRDTYKTLTPAQVRQSLSEITSEFKNSSEAIRAAGENTRTFGQRIGTLAQKFGTWFSITRVMMAGVRTIRQMVKATIELDDAMTQLRIVTRTTEEAYNSYMESISKTATRVGSSITDLISSTTTYARLGYSLDESSALAEFTAMLQNVGDIDVAAAQDALTAIVKAFGISVDEIESIMDKLVITGNNFPISVSQIAEGMNNASSALAAAGNTFDQSVALLTAANTTIQNAAKSSTGLRTIAARLRSTKTELDELGETMTEAEYGELVAALTKYNVALTDATGEFRSTYDVVADIAAIWENLTSMEQAALANAIAGVRQQSVFYSMVEQFQEASGAMEDMANSAGTLQESYATYMESTTAHINQFKAAFQSLSQTTFSTDFLNGIIDFGTGLLGIIETLMRLTDIIGGLNGVLTITVAIVAIIKADAIRGALFAALTRITTVISTLIGVVPKLITALQVFATMMKASASSTSTAIAVYGQSTSIIGKLTAALNAAGIAATTAQVAMGVFVVAVAAIAGAVAIYQKLHKSTEELVESSNELKESFREFKEQADSNIQTLNDLSDEFERLSEGVDRYGRNISLSADDYERYKEIIEQIVGISPELIEGYDKENGYLVDKNNLLERAIELQEKEYQNELRRMSTTSNISTATAGSVATYSDLMNGDALTTDTAFSNSIWRLFNINDREIPDDMESGEFMARQIMRALGVDNIETELKKYFNEHGYWQSGWFWDDYVDKIAADIESGNSKIISAINFEDAEFEDEDAFQLAIDEAKSAAVEYSDVQSELAAANQDVANQLKLVAESNSHYASLSKDAKQIIDDFVNSFGVEDITKDGWFGGKEIDESAISSIKAEINDFVEKFTPEIQAIADKGFALKLGLDVDGNGLSVGEYEKQVRRLLKDIEDIEDEDLQLYIRASLGIDVDSTSLESDVDKAIAHVKALLVNEPIDRDELQDLLDWYKGEVDEAKELGVDLGQTVYGNIDTNNRQILEWTEDNLNQYKDAIESWGSTVDELRGSVSTVFGGSDFFGEENGVEIAFSPILQTENGPVLLDSNTVHEYIYGLIDKAGGDMSLDTLLQLDTEGLEFDGVLIKNLLADIGETAIKTGESMHFVGDLGGIQTAYNELEAAALSAGMTVDELNEAIASGDIDKLKSIDELLDDMSVEDALNIYYNISAAPHSMTFDELQKKLDTLGVDWNKTVNVWDFSDMVTGLNNVESSISDIASAMNTLKSGTALTVGELTKLALKYPDLLKASDLFTDTSIENQQELLNSILGSYESEYDALIDTKIAELTATNELIKSQIELENEKKNKVVEIADLQANGKLDSEKTYQRLLNELHDLEGQNFVTYSDGVLDVNQDMLGKMLEQQGDGVDESAPIWGALGDMIIEGHSDGLTGALKTFPQYLTKLKSWAGNSLKTLLSNIGTNIGKALSGNTDFVGLTDGIQNLGTVSAGNVTIETQVEGDYTIDGKSVDDWAAEYKDVIEKRVETLTDQITANQTIIDNLTRLKGLDLKSIYGDKPSGSDKDKDGKDELEEYLADIDAYYEALKRLEAIQIRLSSLQSDLEFAETDREKIALTEQLINVYRDEVDALATLNSLRQDTIRNSIGDLQALGFEIEYNSDTNEFLVKNLEHLNELTGSTQEETNKLREETEELINTLDELNSANQEGVDSMRDFQAEIKESKQQVIDYLKDIVTSASDAVDEIQNVFDTLKAAADEYAENGGFISVDAFQDIIALGPQYMQYLRDENGLLVINEENINKVIIAKTRQLAAEQALTYVERLRLALEEGSIENLNTLLYATTDATDATFGLAYAQLELMHAMGDLDDQQYAAALHNIQSIESLANTAIASVGQVAGESSEKMREELENMKSGVDDILKYVMDMLKHRIQQQIDALEDLKDAYGDIIDLRKEALDAAKQEADYEDEVAEKVKEIAKLQERINALSLDDSRDAQAQKIKLEEEMAELQKELSDDQNDYAVDAQKEALDDMKEAYEDEKDAEIAALEETISSYQKLYDMAIDYIESHWNTLYDELITWNTEYGSVLNSEITEAWNNCLAAAQRYGSYVSALNSIDADIEAAGSGGSPTGPGNNTVVGNSNHSTSTKEDSIHAIIKEMYSNSQEHHTASKERKAWLDNRNLQLGTMLAQYGVNTHRDNGTWYMDGSKQLLYDKYKKYIYHRGGIAGDNPTLKQNEIMAVLEKGEAVLDEQKERGLYRLVEFATTLSDKFSELIRSSGLSNVLTGPGGVADVKPDAPPNVTSSEKVSIEFGDTIIYGANEDTVEQHRAITRQQANELLEKLNIKR